MNKRDTSQRRAIRRVFCEASRPLSAHEVLEQAGKYKGGLGIATVYRNIKILRDENWLSVVLNPGMPPRYERADQPPHHYFYCTHCGSAFSVPCQPSLLDPLLPDGFKLESHDLVIYGQCESCCNGETDKCERPSSVFAGRN